MASPEINQAKEAVYLMPTTYSVVEGDDRIGTVGDILPNEFLDCMRPTAEQMLAKSKPITIRVVSPLLDPEDTNYQRNLDERHLHGQLLHINIPLAIE